ncbi:cassette chromosome replicative helicase [Staphylococcus simiae]|uniref:DUF927 domain-containing protein n=1 Tax=Staphylococcus simiae CCM 7213 = CCUG 51256 TaxID=911238 RepID=G5JK75_9STAP|nr:DUF927 domain-containing protein [Staphylococcus simiae]EHJ07405.1 hypothetical protein SS7213T_09434 [Staphylococcus simiae CCM 7213 = CCUG 51256]PNZ09484.1 DUF927 domain-containing protein [Staphylococcus simiae]SNV54609.1 Superfamily II helicase and inactivated derivatives [Staphylococcus simiae]
MSKIYFQKYPFTLYEDGWYEYRKVKNTKDQYENFQISSFIYIKNRFKDPVTKFEKLIITDGQGLELVETADILTSFKLTGLIKYGFNINEVFIKHLSYVLQSMRKSLPLSKLYTGVGVLTTSDGDIIISLDEPYFNSNTSSIQDNEIICDSKYDLAPKGTLDNWINMYKTEVEGNIPMELATIFGISSIVTAFLKTHHQIEFPGIIFSFTGQSSTGKSTAAMLAVSTAGNPTKGNETLFKSWNATRNALESYLGNNFGVPIVLDELSSATFRDSTGLLYSIAEGQGRQRSDKNGDVKSTNNWGTSVISTAEHSIFKDAAKNDGLRVRTIELNEVFTSSSKNSDAIKTVVSQNYGHVMPKIAEFLLSNTQHIIKQFNSDYQWFENELISDTNNTGIRMFKRYAVIIISARIFSQALNVNVSIDSMKTYLCNYHKDTVSERSLAEKAIDIIVQFVAQNRGKFSEGSKLANMIENYGLIELKDDHIQVKMLANVFKNMLEMNQFQDTNNVIDALREKGYIHSDRNRKTTKRSVKNSDGRSQSIVFYHLKIDKSYASLFDLSSVQESSAAFYTAPPKKSKLLEDFLRKTRESEDDDELKL